MRLLLRRIIPGVCALVLLLPLPAAAEHAARPHTPNIHAKGHSPHASSFEGLVDGVRHCDGQTVAAGWEGVHVFDISDPSDPSLMASVTLPCGSHTLTVAGISAGNLIVYSNNSSSSGCVDGTRANDDPVGDFMDIIAVPLANPAGASLLRREPLAGPTTDIRTGCHDAAVIRGTVNLAACASADTVNVWDIGDNSTPGGSIEDPELLYTIVEPGIGTAGSGGRWHSAAFTWDGKVLVLGWEPGGGGLPECEQTDPAVKKSMFFYDAATGSKLRPVRGHQRQLPGRDLGHRLHRPGQSGDRGVVGPSAARTGR